MKAIISDKNVFAASGENVDWDGNCKITRRYVRGWFGLDKVPASCPLKYKEKVDEK